MIRQSARLILLITLCALLASCAIRTAQTPTPADVQPGEDADALYKKAETYYRNNFMSKALEHYLAVVERYPSSPKAPPAYYKIGQIYIRSNSYEKAIHYFKLLISQHPEAPQSVEAHYQLGLCYQRLDNHPMAVQALGYYINVHGAQRVDQAHLMMGDSYLAQKQWNEALLSFANGSGRIDRAEQVEVLKKVRMLLDEKIAAAELLSLIPRMPKGPVTDFCRYRAAQGLIAEGRRNEAARILRDIEFSQKRYKFYEKAEQLLELAEAGAELPPGSLPRDVDETGMVAAPIPSRTRYSVGVLLPLSGRHAVFGREVLHGIMQGVDLFGIGGQVNFQIVIRDTQGEAEVAAKAVNELADDPNTLAIIGPLLSQCAPAAADEAERREIPLIALTRRETIIEGGSWTFRNFITASDQIRTLIEYATDYQGAYRFAVLYPDNAQGRLYRKLFRKLLDPNRYRLVAEVSYPTDETDFKKTIRQLTAAGTFDALFIPDNHRRIALIAPQLVYYGVKDVMLLGNNRWNSDELARTAGGYLHEAVVVDGFFVRSSNPEVTTFVEHFHNQFSQYPSFLAAVGYDTARMIGKVLSNPGVANRDRMRRGLLDLHNFPGVTGELSVSENRETERRLYMLRVGETRMEEMY